MGVIAPVTHGNIKHVSLLSRLVSNMYLFVKCPNEIHSSIYKIISKIFYSIC